MVATTEESKICTVCWEAKDISQFRRRSRLTEDRFNECRACHNAKERLRRAEKGSHRQRKILANYLTQLVRETSDRRVKWLCLAMLQTFGGLEGFVAAYHDYFQAARQKGGMAAYRAIHGLFRLLQYCDANRPDPSEMSDAELEEDVAYMFRGWVRRHPEMAVEAAERLGWTVIPPSESEVAPEDSESTDTDMAPKSATRHEVPKTGFAVEQSPNPKPLPTPPDQDQPDEQPAVVLNSRPYIHPPWHLK